MTILKILFDKYTPSFILPFICYLCYYFSEFYFSKHFNLSFYLFSIIIISIFQFFIFKIYKTIFNLSFILILLSYCTFILFFFGINIVVLSNTFQFYLFKEQIISGPFILIISFILFFLLERYVLLDKKLILFQNIFFINFLIISIFLNFSKLYDNKKIIKNDEYNLTTNKYSDKPKQSLLFIILDEYASPVELNHFSNDSSYYLFNDSLKKRGWFTKTKIYSSETKTILSLASLFNFNTKFNDINFTDVDKLIFSKLGDSLISKKVDIVNFGIFDIEHTKPLTRLYFYPNNFYELIFKYTIYPQLYYNTNGFTKLGINANGSLYHNRYILNNLTDSLTELKVNNKFIYVHLFMPHAPYSFAPEFKIRKEDPSNYLEYWKFTNSKLTPILDSLIRLKKYKIIITGDHGYRGSEKINPHYTFAAFYGFDANVVNSLMNVQDIGFLINNNF